MARIRVLGFEEQRSLLAAAVARASGTGGRASLRLSSKMYFSDSDIELIEGNRSLAASLNRTLSNLGKRFVDAIRKVIVQRGTIRTRLFLTGWKERRVKEGSTVNTAVEIYNETPYSLYVHPKGTPKSRTVFNVDIVGGLLPRFRVELGEDIDRLRPQIARALKADILARAGGRRGRGRAR